MRNVCDASEFVFMFVGGELFNYVVNCGRLPESEACRFLHQIVSGLSFIHSLNIAHRDVKPENLLLDDCKNIKIADFGLSNSFEPGKLLRTACGSPCYAAPEMVRGDPYFGPQIDVWSTGVVLYAMLCGVLPFEDANTAKLYKKITTCAIRFPLHVSPCAQELILAMLATDPVTRVRLGELAQYQWFSNSISQLQTRNACGQVACLPCEAHSDRCDEKVLDEMSANFPNISVDYVVKCLKHNKHNNATATYYLLLAIKSKRVQGRRAHAPIATPEVSGVCPMYSLSPPVAPHCKTSKTPFVIPPPPPPFFRRFAPPSSERPRSGMSKRSSPNISAITSSLCRPTASTAAKQKTPLPAPTRPTYDAMTSRISGRQRLLTGRDTFGNRNTPIVTNTDYRMDSVGESLITSRFITARPRPISSNIQIRSNGGVR